MSKTFYSTSEAAGLFNVHRFTIYRWIKDGKIKTYKIGRHFKIPLSEVEILLKTFGFFGQLSRMFLAIQVVNECVKMRSERILRRLLRGVSMQECNDDDIRIKRHRL
ncbi:MAG: helix-turn-helix domain-containing protein [Deltaproteobacteria bacterium]|nr:helix-turn-helix domain-containing protein [Deltaproteobacteria bacterium]